MNRLAMLLQKNEQGEYLHHFETLAPGVHLALNHAELEAEHAKLTGVALTPPPGPTAEEIKRDEITRLHASIDHLTRWLHRDEAGAHTHTTHHVGGFRTALNHTALQAELDAAVARLKNLEGD